MPNVWGTLLVCIHLLAVVILSHLLAGPRHISIPYLLHNSKGIYYQNLVWGSYNFFDSESMKIPVRTSARSG